MNFKKAVEGTLMEKVFEIMEKGVFAPSPDEPVEKNETLLLDGLSDLEKAILTLSFTIDDEYDAAEEKSKNTGEPVDSKIEARLEESTKILIPFFWNCVRRRIKFDLGEKSLLKIRAGYKVVNVPLHEVVFFSKDQGVYARNC